MVRLFQGRVVSWWEPRAVLWTVRRVNPGLIFWSFGHWRGNWFQEWKRPKKGEPK